MLRKAIIENPTPTVGEILCVFEDNGVLRNVLVTDVSLATALAESPLRSEGRADVESRVFAAAELLASGPGK